MPMAAEPDESHGTRIEFLAATGPASIRIEHPMIGPAAAAGFGAIPDSPRGRADHGDGDGSLMRDRKTTLATVETHRDFVALG